MSGRFPFIDIQDPILRLPRWAIVALNALGGMVGIAGSVHIRFGDSNAWLIGLSIGAFNAAILGITLRNRTHDFSNWRIATIMLVWSMALAMFFSSEGVLIGITASGSLLPTILITVIAIRPRENSVILFGYTAMVIPGIVLFVVFHEFIGGALIGALLGLIAVLYVHPQSFRAPLEESEIDVYADIELPFPPESLPFEHYTIGDDGEIVEKTTRHDD